MQSDMNRLSDTSMSTLVDEGQSYHRSMWAPDPSVEYHPEPVDELHGMPLPPYYPSAPPTMGASGSAYYPQSALPLPEMVPLTREDMILRAGSLYSSQHELQSAKYALLDVGLKRPFYNEVEPFAVGDTLSQPSTSGSCDTIEGSEDFQEVKPKSDPAGKGSPQFVQLMDAKLENISDDAGASIHRLSKPVSLHLEENLNSVINGWHEYEKSACRRILWFTRNQFDTEVQLNFKSIRSDEWIPDMVAISCILDQPTSSYYFTSIDFINLLEFIIGRKLSIEEKNRTRRNLEAFKPMTISKHSVEHVNFFWLIMSFSLPRPRNIVREIKVFPWGILQEALNKIVSKYHLVHIE